MVCVCVLLLYYVYLYTMHGNIALGTEKKKAGWNIDHVAIFLVGPGPNQAAIGRNMRKYGKASCNSAV